MGKWLEGDLRIDKYAWEIDLDGYYLSWIKINISVAPLHPSVCYRWWPDLFYICFTGWKKRFTCIHTHAKEHVSIRYPRDRCYRSRKLCIYPLSCLLCSPSLFAANVGLTPMKSHLQRRAQILGHHIGEGGIHQWSSILARTVTPCTTNSSC